MTPLLQSIQVKIFVTAIFIGIFSVSEVISVRDIWWCIC